MNNISLISAPRKLKGTAGSWSAVDQLEASQRMAEMEYIIARIWHASEHGGMDNAVAQAAVWAEENL